MSIRVLLFGVLAEKRGQREMLLSLKTSASLGEVVSEAGCEDFKPLLLAVNQVQTSDEALVIQDGDEVAIMPPFSGG